MFVCEAICKGLSVQLDADKQGQSLLATPHGTEKESRDIKAQLERDYKVLEESYDEELEKAWDDVTGAELNPAKVQVARQEEISYIRKMKLHRKVPEEECWNNTGKAPMKLRRIDINKGDPKEPNYRSRLVATNNTHKRDDLFAATPPVEALKLSISATATGGQG